MRSFLYVPGDRPDRIATALASPADCAVVDFEDSVSAAHKEAARGQTVEAIRSIGDGRARIALRVNSLASGLIDDDLAALEEIWSRLEFIVLPMTEDASTVSEVSAKLDEADVRAALTGDGPRLIALVETAAGVLSAREIAAADPRVHTLAFGPADLSSQLGVTPSAAGEELREARALLVLAAAAAGRERPIDGPWLNLNDADGLRESAANARRLGFSGKQVIHPNQLQIVHEAFAPSAAELEWASNVVAAFEAAEAQGVASIRLDDGTFVDYPVARRAAAILEQSAHS